MKKIYPLLISIFLFLGKIYGQDCPLPVGSAALEGNNISANFLLAGDLFWDREDPHFMVKDGIQFPFASTMFNGGIWLGAMDSLGNIKLAVARYPGQNRKDFVAGPILGDNNQFDFACEDYDRFWEVFGYEIQQHRADFADNGSIDFPIKNIFAYPAKGNPFFEDYHNFSLPNDDSDLAPFFDNNNDQIYNPVDGDYPLPASVGEGVIPSHIIWGIFNDAGTLHTESPMSTPLDVEVHLTGWAFSCEDNELLNHSIFTSHKIINKGSERLDSLFFGMHHASGLGCEVDDFLGSIPDLNTYFFYNRDDQDGSTNPDGQFLCSASSNAEISNFEAIPPVQAATILNQEMSSFMYYKTYEPFELGGPDLIPEYYHFLNGRWSLGLPLTFGGAGYSSTNPTTAFAFPDNPNDPNGWSMEHTSLSFDYRPTLANVYLEQLQPDAAVTIEMAYTTYQDTATGRLEKVNLVYDNTPLLQQMYDNQFQSACTISNCVEDCVWTGDANRDSIVNVCDILHIGLNFGKAETVRNKPLIFSPFAGENWNETFDQIDLKHADCNGNATIDSSDFELVDFYWESSYKTAPIQDEYPYGNELLFSSSSNPNLSIDTLQPDDTGVLRLKINQSEALAGLAYTVELDTTWLEFESITPIPPWNATDGDYQYSRRGSQPGEAHFAFVKTDGENSVTSGGSTIGLFTIRGKDSDFEQVQTLVRVKNIKAVLNDGTQLDYGAKDFIVNLINPNGSGIILNDETLEKNTVEIFPNPTVDLLNIQFRNPTEAQIAIFDTYEKVLLQSTFNNQDLLQISTTHFSSGIYFLKIKTEGEELIRKFVKN